MYGLALCSNVWDDTICELISGWGGDGFMLIFLFCWTLIGDLM